MASTATIIQNCNKMMLKRKLLPLDIKFFSTCIREKLRSTFAKVKYPKDIKENTIWRITNTMLRSELHMHYEFNAIYTLCERRHESRTSASKLKKKALVYFQIFERNIYERAGGADNWPNIYKECAGKRQSPIDLSSAVLSSLPPLKVCERYSRVPQSLQVSRGDHTVYITASFENDEKVVVQGGPLSNSYALAQIHFHWGDEDSIGSEHSINGTFHAMEAHAAHYNMKYRSMADAKTQPNGIMVISFLFKVAETTASPAMDELANTMKKFQRKPEKTTKVLNPFPLENLLPRFHGGYFTYPGSLTTPPCHETVTWIVKGTPLEISSANMALFRGLYNVQPGMRNNIRPVQPLNDRKIAFVASEKIW